MIRLEHIHKRYGDRNAVHDLSLEIPTGEVCVLIGPSGCGKTTTMRMINRLIEPTSGRVMIDERDAHTLSPHELRRGMGYAIQGVGLFPHLTVAQNIAVVPRLLGWSKDRINTRTKELLELVGLTGYGDAFPRELSGGQAQRVGVARALAADPPILLMDEPFGAVDPLTRERLQDEFLRLQRSLHKTVVFVTHDMDEAIKLADRIAIMRDGKLVQFDTPETLLEQPVDDFVRDFVGADRGLKRLGRVKVREVMRPTIHLHVTDALEQARVKLERERVPSAFVTDENGVLLGWLNRTQSTSTKGSSVREVMVRHAWADIAVMEDASVREALSRMIGEGFRTLAVVDARGCLIGQVDLVTIENINATPTGSAL
jgi:osmoprotectant transport system ATP-binding protein